MYCNPNKMMLRYLPWPGQGRTEMSKILFAEKDGTFVLKFVGDVRVTLGPTISTFLDHLGKCESFQAVVIDLTETDGIDSTSLGMLAKISLCTQKAYGKVPTIVSTNEDITRLLMTVGFDEEFAIATESVRTEAELLEMPQECVSEQNLREQVLEAHRVLMSLNEQNKVEFKDLVKALEQEQSFEHSLAS